MTAATATVRLCRLTHASVHRRVSLSQNSSKKRLTSRKKIEAIAQQVLEASVADETELVWFERRRRASAEDSPEPEAPQITILLRVVDGKRIGWHRTESLDPNRLESGIRHALAVSRIQPRVKRRPVMPKQENLAPCAVDLFDPAVADLHPAAARKLLAQTCEGTSARLAWSETRVAVFNSHGLRRHAHTTEVDLEVACGAGPGAGRSASSARHLSDLAPEKVATRARELRGEGALGSIPEGPVPVVLSPEAATELLNVLNFFAFSSHSFFDGTSFLSKHRNVQVFDRIFNLQDDGTAHPGLPFPFDLEGSSKTPFDLIVDGQPSSPALDRDQGAQAGLRSTAQAAGGGESFYGNLFLRPGEAEDEDLLAAADGGLYIGWLDPPECFDPSHLNLRSVARGVRLVQNGRLGAPLPDLVWEESLLRALARLRAIGQRSVVRIRPSTPLGALSAPAVVLMESEGFQESRR